MEQRYLGAMLGHWESPWQREITKAAQCRASEACRYGHCCYYQTLLQAEAKLCIWRQVPLPSFWLHHAKLKTASWGLQRAGGWRAPLGKHRHQPSGKWSQERETSASTNLTLLPVFVTLRQSAQHTLRLYCRSFQHQEEITVTRRNKSCAPYNMSPRPSSLLLHHLPTICIFFI